MEDDSIIGGEYGDSSIFVTKVTELRNGKLCSNNVHCVWNKNLIVIASQRDHPQIYNISDASEEEINANAITLKTPTQEDVDGVTTIGWNNDGTLLATGDKHGCFRIWNRNGELIFKNDKHYSKIVDLKWNNDGKYIVTVCNDKTIVWDSATGECIKLLFRCSIQGVDWRTNTSFASCGGSYIKVYEVAEENPIKTYQGHTRKVVAIKWNPQGNFLASASDDLTIKITALYRSQRIQNLEGHKERINMIKWSPTGPGTANPKMKQILASASDDKTVRLWDVDRGTCLHILEDTESVRLLDFSPDGKLLASGGDHKCLKIWDSGSGNLVYEYLFIGNISDISWTSTGSKLAVCGKAEKAHVLHIKSVETMDNLLPSHKSEVNLCTWNPIFDLLASCSDDSTARIWDFRLSFLKKVNSRVLSHCTEEEGTKEHYVNSLDWTRDGNFLGTACEDKYARIWTREGQLKKKLGSHKGPLLSIKWNKSGTYILTASSNETFIWDWETGICIQRFSFHRDQIIDIDWQTDTAFASCCKDMFIYVCERNKYEALKKFVGHTNEINVIKWDPQGKFLASCSDDKTVKVWSMKMDTPIHNLQGHSEEVCTIQWSPTGPETANPNQKLILASASFDSTVRLWDVDEGTCLHILRKSKGRIYSIDFNFDGKLLVSGNTEMFVDIWATDSGQLVHRFKGNGSITSVCWNLTGSKLSASTSNGSVLVVKWEP